MNEQLSLEELLDLKIKERNYEALIDMILRHLTLLPYNNELYFKDEGEIIKLLELIETRKIGLIREELIRQKKEIEKEIMSI